VASLLIQHAHLVVTMDDADTHIRDGGIYIEDNVIRQIGESDTLALERPADVTIDASDMVVLPGLINTHHHFYQTLTRNLPAAQNADLFTWLRVHYPIWAGLTPEAIAVSQPIPAAMIASVSPLIGGLLVAIPGWLARSILNVHVQRILVECQFVARLGSSQLASAEQVKATSPVQSLKLRRVSA